MPADQKQNYFRTTKKSCADMHYLCALTRELQAGRFLTNQKDLRQWTRGNTTK